MESYFGPGTTPERVERAIEEAKGRERPSRSVPSTAQRERFFAALAELRKAAEAR